MSRQEDDWGKKLGMAVIIFVVVWVMIIISAILWKLIF